MSHSLPPIERLKAVMARLRDSKDGCPWDVEQTFTTIAPYTLEEAYEVADAIERNDMPALKEELGDLLFQVVFHARMAEEAGLFDFDAVAGALADKMIRRHPHVFGTADVKTAEAQTVAWEEHKAAERKAKAGGGTDAASALAGVPSNLPALLRAQKMQKRASRVGFDWGAAAPALDKVEEELHELRHELHDSAMPVERLEDEIGDLLFATVNVARLAGVDAETALRRATLKFERRFRQVEERLARDGKTPAESNLTEMDAIWTEVKKAERER